MDMNQMGNDMKKDLGELKKANAWSFFSFDRLYFPVVARYFFILLCILSVVFYVIGIGSALFTQGIIAGIGAAVFGVIMLAIGLFFMRIWFELILVSFNIHDAVKDIRDNLKK